MIKEITLNNYGPIERLLCKNLTNINLIIGPNQSGKTIFQKALYSAIKTVEQYGRGKELRTAKEILSDKLHWTFQCQPLGNLVLKGRNVLSFEMKSANELFSYSFGPSTTKSILNLTNSFAPRLANTIFIPAKEILSLQDIIINSRGRYSEFGFDDTYVDLANALRPTKRGKNYKSFSNARQSLGNIIGGKLDYSEEKQEWVFMDDNRKEYQVSMTSEGIKKLSILDLLLGNHYLTDKSIVIIDEIEANLHPSMISQFMDIIVLLAKGGVQFFISSHSYFVIKKLHLIAQRDQMSIPVISMSSDSAVVGNLKNSMPKNSIIDESINLYKEEINL